MTDISPLAIYYDYTCPFAYSATVWTRQLRELLGGEISFTWRAFPLEQVNSLAGDDWKLWEQPDDYPSQSLLAFRAAKAAARQGEAAFELFHYALMDLRHVARRTLTRRATILDLARDAGLDGATFERDLDDPALRAEIGADYELGRNTLGVFGTPTLVFPGGGAVYVQMRPAPPIAEAVDFLQTLARHADTQPWLYEVKRPAL